MIASAEIFLPDRISGSTRALNRRRARARDRRRADRIALETGADAAAACPRQFLDGDDPHEIIDFGAAIFFRKAKAEQSDLCRLLIERAWKTARLVPFMGVGLDFLFDKAADHVAIGDVFGGIEGAVGQRSIRQLQRRDISYGTQQLRKMDLHLAPPHPEEPRIFARRLEGWPHALVLPSFETRARARSSG